MAFGIFYDLLLTTPFTGTLDNTQQFDGSTADRDFSLVLGDDANDGSTMQTKINGGVDQIVFSTTDSNVAVNTPESSDVKLSLTQAGLATAIAGAPLNMGITVASGTGGAVQFWIRIAAPAMPSGEYLELSIVDNGTEQL